MNNWSCIKVQDENSMSRQKRAAQLPKGSRNEFLSLIGDMDDTKYPIYMAGKLKNIRRPCLKTLLIKLYAIFSGPTLYTLCTAVLDLEEQTLSIIQGNPKKGEASHVISMSSEKFRMR